MRRLIFSFLLFVGASSALTAQNEPVILEAESASLGTDFSIGNDEAIQFVTPLTDLGGTTNPGSNTKIITFDVTFTEAGAYDLYAKVRVGSGGASDDSFYYGNGFGTKTALTDADWIRVNNISNVGNSTQEEVVTGNGTASGNVWKWINLSEFTGDGAPITFEVTTTGSPLTFQYGSRENGLDLDKLAFGKSNLYFTVANLENGEPGSETLPEEPADYPLSYYQSVQTYVNPIMPGDHPDLTLLKVGDDFYSCGSSFHFTPYLPILHSKDLVHWKEVSRVVPANWSELLNDAPAQGIWQGAITYFYDSYWIYFSNTAGGGQYFCKASSPEGPWSAPVRMNATSSTGATGYDNSVFVDEDGTPYLHIKPGRYINRMQEIGQNGHLVGEVINLDWVNANGQYSWAEGPVMCKRDGWYNYFIAGNVGGGQYVLRSQTLTDNPASWQAMGDFFAPVTDAAATFRAPNHMSQPFQIADGTWWTISHSYEAVGSNDWRGQGRQGLLHQVTWGTNGKPTGSAPTSLPVKKPDLAKGGVPWKLPRSDYFKTTTLDLSWHFLNKTAASQYSLTERSGWLRLKPTAGRTHILHKDAGHFYTLVTRVDMDATAPGTQAGIYLTNGNETVTARLYTGYNNGKKIVFNFGSTTLETENGAGNTVWLKVERRDHNLYGYYGADGVSWTEVGNINVVDLDKEHPNYNSWVGNSHGLFTQGKAADFDLFLYRDGYSEQLVEGYNNFFGINFTDKSTGKVASPATQYGGWLMLGGVEFGEEGRRATTGVTINAAAATGGSVEVWIDDIEADGTKIATLTITNTGGEDTWQDFTMPVDQVTGQHDLFLRFAGGANSFFVKSIRLAPTILSEEEPVTDLEESVMNGVRVYPNPFQHGFTIESTHSLNDYVVYDIAGKVVENGNTKTTYSGTGLHLKPGAYILKVNNSFIRMIKK